MAPAKADKFIREMLHHALITLGTAFGDIGILSMHRSTKEIMSTYLVNTLKLSQSHPGVRTVIRRIADYVYAAIDEEKRNILRLLEPHGKHITTSELLTLDEQMKATGMLGCVYFYAHKGKEAQVLLEKSLHYIELNIPKDQRRSARLYFHLGRVYSLNCNFTKAKAYLNKALHAYRTSKNTSGQINAVCSLSHSYYVVGDFIKANELLDTIQQFNKENKLLHRECIIRSFIESELGNPHRALELMNEVITQCEKMNQQDEFLAWNFVYQGLSYRDIGDYATAHTWTEKGDTLYSHYDTTSRMYAALKMYRSGIYRMVGDYAEADKWLKVALTICEREPKESAEDTGFIKTVLAKVYRNTGYTDMALGKAKEAEKLYIGVFGDKNLRTAWIQMTLAQLYNDQGNYTDARNLLQECLAVHRTMLNNSHPKIGKILSELGYAQVRLGDTKEGQANLEEGLKNYEAYYGKDHLRTAYVLRLLSLSVEAQGDLKAAEAAALRAYTICQNANHPDMIISLECLGEVRLKAGNAQGRSDLKRALAMAEKKFGADSPPHVSRVKTKV